MSDEDPITAPAATDDIPGETPVQKALRLKNDVPLRISSTRS